LGIALVSFESKFLQTKLHRYNLEPDKESDLVLAVEAQLCMEKIVGEVSVHDILTIDRIFPCLNLM
jgi:hypothetical protein